MAKAQRHRGTEAQRHRGTEGKKLSVCSLQLVIIIVIPNESEESLSFRDKISRFARDDKLKIAAIVGY